MTGLEGMILTRVHELRTVWRENELKQAKKTYKLVNTMLEVLDSNGLYGAAVYLRAYDKSEIGSELLNVFNKLLADLGVRSDDDGEPPSGLNQNCIGDALDWYAKHLCQEDGRTLLAEMVLRRMLIHVRYETGAVHEAQS